MLFPEWADSQSFQGTKFRLERYTGCFKTG